MSETAAPPFDLWLEWEFDAPEPPHQPQQNFANVGVTLADGRCYSLNVWTFDFLPLARYDWPYEAKPELQPADYVLPPDLFVQSLTRPMLETAVTNMLEAGELREQWMSADLRRFVDAQHGVYEQALSEIRAGQKQSHWMWFIFPQIDGLGSSPTAKHYAIKGIREATAFSQHFILGPRLKECAEAVMAIDGRSAREIFGTPDDLKLRSSATLFAEVAGRGAVFKRVLDKYFAGQADQKTLDLLS
jgi:uncharacterized protein (DUF1810 family)